MDKDILVDNNIAKNFCNPVNRTYKKFIVWLMEYGVLMVSQKLIVEYISSTGSSCSSTNIATIIYKLTREGRLKKKSKKEIQSIRFKKHVEKSLRSNKRDHEYIKLVILSDRKYAISKDRNLQYDINHFPRIKGIAVDSPEKINYR